MRCGRNIDRTDELLDSMDKWNTNRHKETGLTERVKQSSIEMKGAEVIILDFIKEHVSLKVSPLCGNTIWQDRHFLIKYMPHFHYRKLM